MTASSAPAVMPAAFSGYGEHLNEPTLRRAGRVPRTARRRDKVNDAESLLGVPLGIPNLERLRRAGVVTRVPGSQCLRWGIKSSREERSGHGAEGAHPLHR